MRGTRQGGHFRINCQSQTFYPFSNPEWKAKPSGVWRKQCVVSCHSNCSFYLSFSRVGSLSKKFTVWVVGVGFTDGKSLIRPAEKCSRGASRSVLLPSHCFSDTTWQLSRMCRRFGAFCVINSLLRIERGSFKKCPGRIEGAGKRTRRGRNLRTVASVQLQHITFYWTVVGTKSPERKSLSSQDSFA